MQEEKKEALIVDDGRPGADLTGKKIVVMHNSTLHGTVKKDFAEPGRNEKCFCGSGKKYKKCCLDKKHAKIRDTVRAASEHNDGNKKAGL